MRSAVRASCCSAATTRWARRERSRRCTSRRCSRRPSARCADRVEHEPLVDLAGQTADADRADAAVAVVDRDAAEEEREERIEACPLDRVVLDLLREPPGGGRVA